MEERVWVDTGHTAHCGTVTDGHDGNLDTQEVIPEETASLLDWRKATVRSVYPEKWDFLSPPINSKWKTPTEEADVFHIQAMCDWLYDNWDICLLNILIAQVMVNAVVKGVLFT